MWPLNWFQVGIGAILASLLAFLLHTVDVNRIESTWQAKLDKQEKTMLAQCQKQKDITTNSDQTYETLYNNLLIKFNELRNKPTTCIPVAQPARSCNETNGKNQPPKPNGITTSALYDFAGECEVDRIKVITLQQYINDIFQLKQ